MEQEKMMAAKKPGMNPFAKGGGKAAKGKKEKMCPKCKKPMSKCKC
jgi:predicted  nucleic acid-binding Zn ribbon protein